MIVKQAVPINFWQGLDTKTDEKQVQIGKFLALENSVFNKGGLLQKRNGYGPLPSLPNNESVYLTTLNGNMTALGSAIQAYSAGNETWVSKGNFRPLSISVLPVARSAINQIQCDSVVASNGFVCTVYTEDNGGDVSYFYSVSDSTTGQAIVNPTVITVGSGTVIGPPRVFLLGGFFVVGFTNYISSVYHLQYIAISVSNPTTVTANADLAASFTPSPPASSNSWDGYVLGNKLFFAYYVSGTGVEINYLDNSLNLSSPVTFSGSVATHMSVCADTTSVAVVYASFYDSGGSTGYSVAVDETLQKRMSPTEIIISGTIYNITSAAQNGSVYIAYEVSNQYSYDSTIESNYLQTVSVALPATVTTGTVTGTTTPARADAFLASVGLASKAFIFNGTVYILSEYASELQSTYFLSDLSGNVISRFAYENGGASLITVTGYLPFGLPQAQVSGTSVYIAYLYKDLIESQNTIGLNPTLGPVGMGNIYSQTGVNLITIGFNSNELVSSEIGSSLNITGGLLWSYDGQTLSEQNFNVFPDSIEAVWADSTITPTGSWSSGDTSITVSDATGIVVGMGVVDTSNASYLPAGTVVTSTAGTTIGISQAATHSSSSDNLSFGVFAKPDGSTNSNAYYYQVIYQWTDASGNIIQSAPSVPVAITTTDSATGSITVNVPTLRLSYKSGVKIIIYRWSVENQIYYQTTSIVAPTLNDPTVDSIAYVDSLGDDAIVGNSIIYTTGGAVEDVGGPAAVATTLFDDRLWLIDAEDQNLLWYSKQVIQGTPVEMSDLLTYYVAPTIGAQGPSGPISAIFPMDDKLIIFKKDSIYFINGTGPDNTGANSEYSPLYFITSTVGCTNQSSIVIVPTINGSPGGLMFQSDKGIWLLGRDLSTTYIGAPVEAFNSADVNSAIAIPGTNQVRFTLSTGVTLMYDYYYQQWGTFVGVPALSSTLYQSLHTYINSSGAVAQETPGVYLDNGNPVLLGFTTSWIALAGLQGYQRAFFFYLLGTYFTPHKINLQIAYDYNSSPIQSTLISPVNYGPNYGSTAMPVYGQINPYGGGSSDSGASSNIEQWRVFLTKQRCTSFQITLQEIYDPSFGEPAGQGLTLSGLNLVVAVKKGFRPQPAGTSAGSPG